MSGQKAVRSEGRLRAGMDPDREAAADQELTRERYELVRDRARKRETLARYRRRVRAIGRPTVERRFDYLVAKGVAPRLAFEEALR